MSDWLDRIVDISRRSQGDAFELGPGELGPEIVGLLKGLRLLDNALVIEHGPVLKPGADWIDMEGPVRGVLGGRQVRIRLASARDGRRDCLMRFEADGLDDVVATWLASFDVDLLEALTAFKGVKSYVVSSADFRGEERRRHAFLSEGWPTALQEEELAAGVNFCADTVAYRRDLFESIETAVDQELRGKLFADGPAWFHVVPPQPTRDAVPTLRVRPAKAGGKITLPSFEARLDGAELVLPLDADSQSGPCVCLPGTLTIEEPALQIDVEAAFGFASQTMTARLIKPGVQALSGLLAGGFGTAPLDGLLDALLGKLKAEAWVTVRWPPVPEGTGNTEVVLAAGCSADIDVANAIVLVPGRLLFAARLAFRIDHPFAADSVLLSGRMEGSLVLPAGTQEKKPVCLDASLEVPGWYFTASASNVRIDDLQHAFGLDQMHLPAGLNADTVNVRLAGDAATRSFSAALAFDEAQTWPDMVEHEDWVLRNLAIQVDYNGESQDFEFMVSATLVFQENFKFDVSGGYEHGWVLRGGMREDSSLNVSDAINKGLLKDLSLPWELPEGLVLSDVAFAAKFSSNFLEVRGRTEAKKPWTPIAGLGLTVEALQFQREGKKTRATLAVRLSFDVVDLLLEASAPEDTKKGWEFKGSTGQPIKIEALFDRICNAFKVDPKPVLPPVLESFQIDNLEVSYLTESGTFKFTCKGQFEVNGTKAQSVIEIEKEKSTSKLSVRGKVTIGELPFEGNINTGQESRTFLGTFDGRKSKPRIAPKTFLEGVLSSEITDNLPDLEITLNEALFAYNKTNKANDKATESSGFLFGAGFEINARIDLSKVGAVGSLLGGQEVGLEDLRVLVASTDFYAEEVKNLNALLPGNIEKLPEPDLEKGKDTVALSKGFNLSGKLVLGKLTPAPLMLPAAGAGETPPGRDVQEGPKERREPSAETSSAKWIDIKKSLGPLYVGRVGFRYQERVPGPSQSPGIGLLLDAAVDLAGLHVGLVGFQVNYPLQGLKEVTWPVFGLDGLELSYAGGPLQITGAFLKVPDKKPPEPPQYDGMALIKAANFMITGFGSYTTVDGAPSIFIFAILHAELGGPPFFRVRGLAAGFGYNRRLTLPPIEQVHKFPLVRAALEEDFITKDTPVGEVLGTLRDYIPPSSGDYWLAAGVRFSSFEMIHSVALLSVSFGHEVEIGVLGLSKMSLPKGVPPGNELAYAELALRAVIRPEEGTVAVEGRLTDESYIFSKDCRLTGGFAFFLWTTKPHAGDFVVTLGGYHPKFPRPEHYPVVPRLGVNWQVSKELAVTAEMYFALTPSCLMAGGKLSATYHSGTIHAWFVTYADFLVGWQPFYYTADMGVFIAVTADLELLSIHAEVNAGLHLWGPPFAGQIDVDLDVISFAVRFGGPKTLPAPLKAGSFKETFLPQMASDPTRWDVLVTQITSGLIRQETREKDEPLRVANAHALTLSVQSLVPVSKFEGIVDAASSAITATDTLGVQPMGKTTLDSRLSVKIGRIQATGKTVPVATKNVRVSPVENGVPEALWRKASETGKVALPKAEAKTITATVGIRLSFDPIPPEGALLAMAIERFAYETFNKPIPGDFQPTLERASGGGIEEVMTEKTAGDRGAVLEVLARNRLDLNKVDLTELVKHRDSYFQADPRVCALGELHEGIS